MMHVATKQNLTIRIPDNDRELLEAIAEREMRSVSNQTIWLLHTGMQNYLKDNDLVRDSEEKKLITITEAMAKLDQKGDPTLDLGQEG
jgi:uncharacterized protein (DUF1778 family)